MRQQPLRHVRPAHDPMSDGGEAALSWLAAKRDREEALPPVAAMPFRRS
jgi:hypothetical protein